MDVSTSLVTAKAQAIDVAGRVMLRQFLQMTPDAITGDMNVAIEGEWLGHPAGPFTMDAGKMQQCIDRFEQQANPMVVDYEHNSMGGDSRAAGWVQSLYCKHGDDGAELWAHVEWTPTAAAMIKNGEYRYCSPVIDFGAKDRATGEHVPVELFNVALTNNPFLDGMHPIQLSRVAAAQPPPEKKPEDGEAKADAPPPDGEDAPAEADAESTTEDAQPGDDAEDAAADTEPAPAPLPDPGITPPEASGIEAALTPFIEQCMKTSGGSKAAVLAALNEVADQVGGIVRTKLDQHDGSAADAQEIAMSDKPTTETVVATAPVVAAPADPLVIALARQIGELTQALQADKAERVEAAKKQDETAAAQLARQNEARIQAMLDDGRLSEGEVETARLCMSRGDDVFEGVYGKRVAGSAVPLNKRQAGVDASATADKDAVNANGEQLFPQEEASLKLLMSRGQSREAAMKTVLAYRPTLIANAKARGVALTH